MIKLEGHSGCNLTFVKTKENFVIRKTSKSVEYNFRLIQQFEKQKNFLHNFIKTPKVYDNGIDNSGLFYFEMEYIKGLKFNEYVKSKKFNEVLEVFTKILNFVFANFNNEVIDQSSQIISKIDSITKTKLIDNHTIDQLKQYSNLKLNMGYCHGDLTFENIIISNNEIYLIDFLDSYIESPIIDISKLIQEFDLNWSNRNSEFGNTISLIRNIFLKRKLYEKINKYNINTFTVELQSKLTLMRILPYTNSISLQLKLLNIINK